MIVGILSDTHDKLPAMRAGMRALAINGAKYFIHCGDIGGTQCIDCLAGHPSAFVWGNNDWDRAGLSDYATGLGITCLEGGGVVELEGKSIFVTHGDDAPLLRRILTEQKYDYLLLGHTHSTLDSREGKLHVINPGALYRAATKTVALLDLDRDVVQFLEVNV